MQDDQRPSGKADLKREGDAYLLPGRVEQLEHEQAELKKHDQEYKQKDIAYKDRQLVLDGNLIRLTGWLVVVGLLGGAIAVWQSVIAQQAATAARDAAVAATAAVRATENQTVIQLGQMDVMREQMTAATRQVDAAVAAVEESRRANLLAGRGLELTRQQVYAGERAYLLIEDVQLRQSGSLAANQEARLQWRIVNKGQTPALNLATFWSFWIGPRGSDPRPEIGKGYSERHTIGAGDAEPSPDMRGIFLNDIDGYRFTPDDIRRLRSGEDLNVRMIVFYDTVFTGIRGQTQIRGFYEGSRFSTFTEMR